MDTVVSEAVLELLFVVATDGLMETELTVARESRREEKAREKDENLLLAWDWGR